MNKGTIYSSTMESWQISIKKLLDAVEMQALVAIRDTILLKPNLVEALHPPITTPVALMEVIVDYLQDRFPQKKLIIGEGCGSTSYDTFHAFQKLGYTSLAARKKIKLIDLNTEKLVRYENEECRRWPTMYLPELLEDVFLISVPVLKAHSLSRVTLTMKNMMGCAPPEHYQGNGGGWAKSTFHHRIHEAIYDLNRYRTPDFTILDATIGMAKAHLWGPHCNPPVNILAAATDPVAIDSYGTSLLGSNWRDIDHIALAHQNLGIAEPLDIIQIN